MSERLLVGVGVGVVYSKTGSVAGGVMLVGCRVIVQMVIKLIPLLLEVLEDVFVRALVVRVLVVGKVSWLSGGVE
eukprot:6677551-Heterocapsa_arctica.AAC.1